MAFTFPLRDNAIAEHYDHLRINILVSDPDFASGIGVRVREFKLHSGFSLVQVRQVGSFASANPADGRSN